MEDREINQELTDFLGVSDVESADQYIAFVEKFAKDNMNEPTFKATKVIAAIQEVEGLTDRQRMWWAYKIAQIPPQVWQRIYFQAGIQDFLPKN